MHRIRRFGFFGITVAGLVAASVVGLYRASQSVPDFYETALELESVAAGQAGDALERQVVEMANDLEEGDRWELVLTDQQVNGWLATDLTEKFPHLLPPQLQQPRVAFQGKTTFVACQLNSGKVSTVLSLQLDPYLTQRPNEIAVRVRRVRAGMLPVPLTKLLDQISEAAHRSGLSLRWSQVDGDPVALVALPVERPEIRSGVMLEHGRNGRLRHGRRTQAGRIDDGRASTSVRGFQRNRCQQPSLTARIKRQSKFGLNPLAMHVRDTAVGFIHDPVQQAAIPACHATPSAGNWSFMVKVLESMVRQRVELCEWARFAG
jgi:hypothetical protein